jgi:hypothetical protein
MADDANLAQYNYIYTLAIKPGIKRDGTVFESEEFTDGVWCRFQRERARKIGGYRKLFSSFNGIYRGLIAVPYNGVNYVFAGDAFELDVFTTNTTFGTGIGPFAAQIFPGTVFANIVAGTVASPSFQIKGDATASFAPGNTVILDQETPVNYTILTSTFATPNTTVTLTSGFAGTPTKVWLNNEAVFTPDLATGPFTNDWQFDALFNPTTTQLNLLAHPGKNLTNIDNGVVSQVLIGNVAPASGNTWSFTGLSDSEGQNPTYKPISISGGVCVLYPFIFVYGTAGFIANNNVSSTYIDRTLYDWNGPLANQTNVSSSKIVKGMTMRGGTNAPSGLFWATDSLIRVSFTPANAPIYWSYDIVSSQISIMSSSGVVEMDGIYFWMGVDRFYLYNGGVKVLPNDKNVNYLFDNINYAQRQKVWATKIPRYNEIWFFYPRGTSTECNDAIIYNTKDQIWYDAGMAEGAQRSCGYTTEIFPTPIWADWNTNVVFTPPNIIIDTPTGLPPYADNQFYIAGNQTNKFSPGDYVSFSNVPGDTVYLVTNSVNIFNTTIGTPGVTLVTCSTAFLNTITIGSVVYVANGGYTLWQHEFGTNRVDDSGEFAIYSSVTTGDISWIGGTPSGDNLQGINRRMHIRRLEPNFLQAGQMALTILGKKFAGSAATEDSGPYYFNQDTGKIDLRVEHRLIRLKFTSNELNGNYEMGRNILTAEYGDERP